MKKLIMSLDVGKHDTKATGRNIEGSEKDLKKYLLELRCIILQKDF